ncbi:MAG: glycoside hydrolase family 15 protein, partial [Planctomycetota bacterium]
AYFRKHRRRFVDVIESGAAPKDPMKRPHIRFNGRDLEEITETRWAHAQNDALGYFLWFYCRLVNREILEIRQEDVDMLGLFALYFRTVRYWRDEDSGHWEETRKTNASSIGVVVAALREFRKLLQERGLDCRYENESVAPSLGRSIAKGERALRRILPAECIQRKSARKRRYDAALLFLIYPLEVVEEDMADEILGDVIENLQGDYGIRRYLGDSFWAPDYKKKLPPEERTSYRGDDISARDALLSGKGDEAQWCIFDPIISVIWGLRFQKTGAQEYLDKQALYLNRSLGQITEKFECPELYYLENGRYVPGDVVPLLWTQANLMIALKVMAKSLG